MAGFGLQVVSCTTAIAVFTLFFGINAGYSKLRFWFYPGCWDAGFWVV